MGTPKTLLEALQNAAQEINSLADDERIYPVDSIITEKHIRDFLAQKFGTAFLKNAETPTETELKKLWNEITKG